jgi:hypothetical protein
MVRRGEIMFFEEQAQIVLARVDGDQNFDRFSVVVPQPIAIVVRDHPRHAARGAEELDGAGLPVARAENDRATLVFRR